jgi:hypothetical protein
MVLKYMVSDTDLTSSQAEKPQAQSAPPEKTKLPPPKKPKPSPIKRKAPAPMSRVKLLFLVLVNVALLAYAYYRWAPPSFWRPGKGLANSGKNIAALDFLTANKVKVTGIMHYDKNPAALVSGRVVNEGDVVEGCTVVKIYKDKVEFEKDGSRFTRKITE